LPVTRHPVLNIVYKKSGQNPLFHISSERFTISQVSKKDVSRLSKMPQCGAPLNLVLLGFSTGVKCLPYGMRSLFNWGSIPFHISSFRSSVPYSVSPSVGRACPPMKGLIPLSLPPHIKAMESLWNPGS